MRGALKSTSVSLLILAACGSKPDDEFFASEATTSLNTSGSTSTSVGGSVSVTSTTATGATNSTSTSDASATNSTTGTSGGGGATSTTSSSGGTSAATNGAGGNTANSNGGGPTTTTGSGGGAGTTDPLLDDFEDGDIELPPLGAPARVGRWYYYYDHAPDREFAQNPVTVDGSLVMHVSGYSELDPEFAYGGLAVDLQNSGGLPDSGTRIPYDLSGYDGVVFRGRGSGSLRVEILTADVAPNDRGGTCNAGDACGDAHYELMDLADVWKDYTIQFGGLVQAGWGAEFSFDASRVIGIAFEHVGTGQYEFWVDDVKFYSN